MAISRLSTGKAKLRAGQRYSSGGSHKWLPLWFLLPSMIILLVLQIYPSLYSFYLSTTRVRAGTSQDVGLANFERLLNSPTFHESLRHSVVYTFFCLIFTVA